MNTLSPLIPSCENCLKVLDDEATLREWNRGNASDVFNGQSVFVACIEHRPRLDALLSTMESV